MRKRIYSDFSYIFFADFIIDMIFRDKYILEFYFILILFFEMEIQSLKSFHFSLFTRILI